MVRLNSYYYRRVPLHRHGQEIFFEFWQPPERVLTKRMTLGNTEKKSKGMMTAAQGVITSEEEQGL